MLRSGRFRQVPLITNVPSNDMRNGNLVDYLNGTPIFNPDGMSIDPANVPISQVSANMLKYFYPLPNSGSSTDYQNNYRVNYPAPISSDQADVRLVEGGTFHFGAEASNVFNHRNYETPDMNVDDGPTGFGIITALQTAEDAGPRNIEITARISF